MIASPAFPLLLVAAAALGVDPPAGVPTAQAVRRQVLEWVAAQHPSPAVRAEADRHWAALSERAMGPELLAQSAATFALVDRRAAELVAACAKPHVPGPVARQAWLADTKTSPLVAHNLRLYYGRYLVQQSLFDEALEQLTGLQPTEVVDPQSLWFYRALANYRLAARDPSLRDIARLLSAAEHGPRRYTVLAELMREDLKRLEPDTLAHIGRRMDDIRRRLALGHAGPKVRKVENGVVESLDKLIKELEDQLGDSQSAAGAAMQPARPADESRPLGGKGKGDVLQRNVGSKSGWGNLPPKEREEALQQVGREFPAHYREIIEQYFRRLAAEGEKSGERE
jgi:hypothetical protein